MTETKIIEVCAGDYWENETDVNFRFCLAKNRMKNSENTMFLMDGTTYSEQADFAEEFGCTAEFVKAYREAMDLGGEFILFYV